MIKIEFSSAIAIFSCLPIFLVFVLWIFYNYRRNDIVSETKYLQQCPYCTYVFFNYTPAGQNKGENTKEDSKSDRHEQHRAGSGQLKTNALICPRCQSYINLEDQATKEKT